MRVSSQSARTPPAGLYMFSPDNVDVLSLFKTRYQILLLLVALQKHYGVNTGALGVGR